MITRSSPSGTEEIPLRLKGIGDSLMLTFDPVLPIEELVIQAGKAFERLGHLTVNARVVLDSGEKEIPAGLLVEMGKFLKERFRVGTVTKAPKVMYRKSSRAVKRRDNSPEKAALTMAGRIRSGQRVVSKNHLTIYGDVNPGAEVVAAGDILILGSLKGSALAGQPDNTSAIVIAFDFRPTQVQIGGHVAAGLPPLKEKRIEFACVMGGHIEVKDYLKENPFSSMPFPVIRN